MASKALQDIIDDATANRTLTAFIAGNAPGGKDPWRELGAAVHEKQYNARWKALSDATAYNRERTAALGAVKTNVQKVYSEAYAKYITQGFPQTLAEQYAMAAASTTYSLDRNIMEVEFPTAANVLNSMTNLEQKAADSVLNLEGAKYARAVSGARVEPLQAPRRSRRTARRRTRK